MVEGVVAVARKPQVLDVSSQALEDRHGKLQCTVLYSVEFQVNSFAVGLFRFRNDP